METTDTKEAFNEHRRSHGGYGFRCACCSRWGVPNKKAKQRDSRFVRRKLRVNLRSHANTFK